MSTTVETLRALRAGDLVTVSSPELRKPRTLVVTRDADVSAERVVVFVSSGRARRVQGGVIEWSQSARGESVVYQPTMLQEYVTVSSLERRAAVTA